MAPPAMALTEAKQAQDVLGAHVGALDLVQGAELEPEEDASAVEGPVEAHIPQLV